MADGWMYSQVGEEAGTGAIGSGKRRRSSSSSFFAPFAILRACARLIYAIISSSAAATSSSAELETGDGVDMDCRLEPGVEGGTMFEIAGDVRVIGRETFGARSLKDFEGVNPANLEEIDW
jgi:hypothetical protein